MSFQTINLCCALVPSLLACATSSPTPAPASARTSTGQAREGKRPLRDTQLFVREVGPVEAPTIVVIHGGPGGNHRSLRPLETLAPEFRVVLYDQRGTGESDRFNISSETSEELRALTLEQNVLDLEALRMQLGKDKIVLVGHSWGAALAVFYAASYPQHVEKLVVYSGGPEDPALLKQKKKAHFGKLTDEEKALMKTRIAKLEEAVGKTAPQNELDGLFVAIAEIMFPSLNCERPAKGANEIGRGGFWASQSVNQYIETFDRAAFAPKLKAVTAPTLLTWGRCEPAPQERLTWMLDHLPNARFVVFEKSGHNAMEEEPALFFETLKAFLKGSALPLRSVHSRAELEKGD